MQTIMIIRPGLRPYKKGRICVEYTTINDDNVHAAIKSAIESHHWQRVGLEVVTALYPEEIASMAGLWVGRHTNGGWRGGNLVYGDVSKYVWSKEPGIPDFDRGEYLAGQHPHIGSRTTPPQHEGWYLPIRRIAHHEWVVLGNDYDNRNSELTPEEIEEAKRVAKTSSFNFFAVVTT